MDVDNLDLEDGFEAEEICPDDWNKLSQSESEYEPSQQSLADAEQAEQSNSPPSDESTPNVKRIIVDKNKLLDLFKVCNHPGCGFPTDEEDITVTIIGAAMSVTAICFNGHVNKWNSSGQVGEGKKKKYLINILLAAYTLLCGLNIGQVVEYFKHISLECVSRSFFFNLQSSFLHRIIWMTWLFSQKKEIARLQEMNKQGEKTRLAGDGKYDSPGFSASYCTYTVQSTNTKQIVDFWVAAKHVVKSSSAMEPYACHTILKSLVWDHHLQIDSFTTDRSSTMKTLLSAFNEELPEGYTKIHHGYDVWHWIKAVLKDLWTASKLVSCQSLNEWIPSIKNQLWWAFQNSIGNLDLLKERILSIPSHLTNIHNFPKNKKHKKCSHGELGEKAWLLPDSKAIAKVRAALNGYKGIRVGDLEMMLEFEHTGDLECFNALLNKYCPKQYFYRHRTMLSRTACAALDHNTNTDREQAQTSKGVPRFDLVKQRHGKKYYAKIIKVDKDQSWREMVVALLIQCIESGTRPRDMMPILDDEPSVRPVIQKPDKKDAIRFHQSRMARNGSNVQ